MQKQAAFGKIAQVRAKLMLKDAYEAGVRYGMEKKAGYEGELWRNLIPAAVPFGGLAYGPANLVGGAAGLIGKTPTKEEMAAMNASPNKSFIPGVGGYRAAQRVKHSVKDSGRVGPLISELASGVTAPLATGALTGALGGMAGLGYGALTGEDIGESAGVGATVGGIAGLGGASLAHIVGFITGLIKKRRTTEDQKKMDEGGTEQASNYLLPGVGAYNITQRLRSTSNVK